MKKKLIIFCLLIYQLNYYAQASFTEVGVKQGLNYIFPGIDYIDLGAGVTIIDVNNDGWDDIFQPGGIFKPKLWLNNKGKFEDKTKEYFSFHLDSCFVQASASGDFDNDGFSDLFICNFGKGVAHGDKKAPILLKNIKGKYFTPVCVDVFNDVGFYTSACWGDINKDGYLDLYLTNYLSWMNHTYFTEDSINGFDPICNENKFFINQNGKTFTEVSEKYKFNDNGCGLTAGFTDYDNDNDLDLMLLNDFGEWNHKGNLLFRNEFPKDSFTNVSVTSGFYNEIYGMGLGIGDYDNDGDLDYYVTNIGQNILLKNNGVGNFSSLANQLNIDNTWVIKDTLRATSWSPLFFDADNDGDLDLYISTGNIKTLTPRTAIKDPNKFYLNDGNGIFSDVSKTSNTDDILSHRGAAFFDFDHDGDMDIVSTIVKMGWADFGGLDQRIKLYRNDLKKSKHSKWIGFKLIADNNINKESLGARVEIEVKNKKQIRELDGGSSHSSQSTKILYFGLGKNKKVDKLKVNWLGLKTIELKNLKAGHVYKINQYGEIKILY